MATHFDRVGGRFAVLGMLRSFYDRVFDDHMIGFFFAKSDKQRLIEREYELVARSLGCDVHYSGAPLREAHQKFPINAGQFDRRMKLLDDALKASGFDDAARQVVLEEAERLRPAILRRDLSC